MSRLAAPGPSVVVLAGHGQQLHTCTVSIKRQKHVTRVQLDSHEFTGLA